MRFLYKADRNYVLSLVPR